jgi:hypothetical protein
MGSVDVTTSGILAIILGSSLLATLLSKLFDRGSANAENLRSGYAVATEALNAWGHFPFRVRRRTDDDLQTLKDLEALGAKIQESLAHSTAWVSSESGPVGEIYNDLVTLLRAEVAIHARIAWAMPPASHAGDMNLSGPPKLDEESSGEFGGLIPAEWILVQLFSRTLRYRFGWRRYFLPPSYLRSRFKRMGIVSTAEQALRTRSGRQLLVVDQNSG